MVFLHNTQIPEVSPSANVNRIDTYFCQPTHPYTIYRHLFINANGLWRYSLVEHKFDTLKCWVHFFTMITTINHLQSVYEQKKHYLLVRIKIHSFKSWIEAIMYLMLIVNLYFYRIDLFLIEEKKSTNLWVSRKLTSVYLFQNQIRSVIICDFNWMPDVDF